MGFAVSNQLSLTEIVMANKLLAGVILRSIPAGAITAISDVIVPDIFTPSVQNITEEKSRLVQSGALATSAMLSTLLGGGGKTFDVPFFKDLVNEAENISSDDEDDSFTGGSANSAPRKTSMGQQTAVRLSRNQSWSSADLAAELNDADPMSSIEQRVGTYWSRRLQAAFIATVTGIFAMNAAAPSGGSTHTLNDMTHDISGASFDEDTTTFSTEAFLDALITMGDSDEDLGIVMVHSIVYNRMRKNNLIDFIPDSEGRVVIPTYLGRTVIVDDGMPNTSGVYDTWIFGAGAVQLGTNSPKTPTATERKEDSGNGGGSEILYNRIIWCIHPVGHQFIGTPTSQGGPSNAATSGNLAAATSWRRTFTERKQIKIARLITREHA